MRMCQMWLLLLFHPPFRSHTSLCHCLFSLQLHFPSSRHSILMLTHLFLLKLIQHLIWTLYSWWICCFLQSTQLLLLILHSTHLSLLSTHPSLLLTHPFILSTHLLLMQVHPFKETCNSQMLGLSQMSKMYHPLLHPLLIHWQPPAWSLWLKVQLGPLHVLAQRIVKGLHGQLPWSSMTWPWASWPGGKLYSHTNDVATWNLEGEDALEVWAWNPQGSSTTTTAVTATSCKSWLVDLCCLLDLYIYQDAPQLVFVLWLSNHVPYMYHSQSQTNHGSQINFRPAH